MKNNAKDIIYDMADILFRLGIIDERYESFGITMKLYMDKDGNTQKVLVSSEQPQRV